MTAELAVELSDLGGWAGAVDRCGTDASGVESYARSHVSDGDFGAILELITADYEALLPAFHDVLAADAARLASTASALRSQRDDYRDTDQSVAEKFGDQSGITRDGDAAWFRQLPSVLPVESPSMGGYTLPEVSFGYLLDKVSDLLSFIGGPDPRDYVTRWIAGDVEKAGLQASAWEHASECVRQIEANLTAGSAAISGTWQGLAANAAASRMETWLTALSTQAGGMEQMAGHLRDMADQAVQMAQVVVDIVKTVISLASAALSSAYIPFWGQAKLIKSAKEALILINNARKVITVFWNALVMIKDGILMAVVAFSVDALPATPVSS